MGNWNRIADPERDRIIAHALAGKQPSLIVREEDVNSDITTIYSVLCQARKQGIPIQRFPCRALRKHDGVVVRVFLWHKAHLGLMDRAAAARKMSRSALINQLVGVVLRETPSFIDAILDDGVTTDAA